MAKNMSKGNTSSTDGYNSKTAVKLTSSSIVGTKANGNLTTGRINMGSQSPKDPKNYNYTDLKSESNKLLFAGKPDVITFYAKYKRGESGNYNGQLKAILHDKINFKDPAHGEEKVLMAKHILGQTTIGITPSDDWTRFEGEFKYSNLEADTTYMLINVTTNPEPGATAGDELILDDVTFVYRSELKNAQLGKAKLTIPNNGETSISDYRYDPKMLKLTSNGQGAIVKTSFDENQDLLTVEVIGNDISINPNNKHIYQFKFNKNGIIPEPADPSEDEKEEEGIDAAYQVSNSDFETDWTDKNEPGNGWYSYVSANATGLGWKGNIAINNSKGNTQKLTPGHNSNTAVKLVSKWMFFTNVNGNLTTGRIHMGENSPAGHKNYNYTDLKSDNNQLLFAGRPDSLVFYAKYKRGGKGEYGGQLRAFLHDKIEFKDPSYDEEKEQLKKHILSETVVDIMPSTDWVKYEKAMTYTDLKADSSYMLINLFTNPTPGATTGDELDFDDFRFIYNSELSKISYDGEDINIPTPGEISYISAVYDYEKIDLKTNAYAAKVKKSYDSETNILTITVFGDDYKINKDNKHEYKFRFRRPHQDVATYQLPNGDFEEEWDNTNEPGNGWYSYASANTKQLGAKAKDVKSTLLNNLIKTEGYKSETAVMILDKGNMTTGRIHLGSEDLDSPDNYNYTDRASDNHLLFKGQPDSIAFYAKYIDSKDDNSFGEIKAILHRDIDFRNPSEVGQEEYKLAEAKAKIASQPQWKRYSQPFVYTNHQPGDKQYILLSAINHSEGNEENKGKLIIDNVVFVYNSELSRITYDNEEIAIPENGEAVKIRKIYDPEKLNISTNARAAKVETQIDSNSAILTVTIKGNDIESNPQNKHVYKFQFRQPKENIANYQMPNGGFEENWEEANEPGNGWYSIVSANAIDETGVAFKQSILRNTTKTEGYKSATAILLQNNSILTTGRINLASSDYKSNQNYCYTERDTENHLLFKGQPDSISFYAKFAKEGEAACEVKAILHGDTDYRDPADEAVKEAQKEYKIAESTTTINPSNDWTKYSIPFVYSDNNRKEKSYMLIKASIQSEQTAKLALDDFVFVYNSELKTFEYDGKAMPISKTDTIKIEGSYNPDKMGKIETNAHAATLSIDYDRDTNELSIYIYGNDFEVNKNNYHTYVYQFEQGEGIDDVRPYSDKKVNVYSIDGILIKKNVTKDVAIKDLPNGIYIIGNEKVVIK
ncbi:hypothetical protein [Falsiporphyromonas endometrii]|uniref:Uncharacterized protein n=1 Tax=Falsiporphyromonas endometrii TaxID=1387297 RepID=A0ABV9K500_9PORP